VPRKPVGNRRGVNRRAAAIVLSQGRRRKKNWPVQARGSYYPRPALEDAPMIMKLTTNNKASIWVNLDQVVQISIIAVETGAPSTELIMTTGAAIAVFETPDDIAQSAKSR
jgi:hypothetical protein